jgi:hypothetical protein
VGNFLYSTRVMKLNKLSMMGGLLLVLSSSALSGQHSSKGVIARGAYLSVNPSFEKLYQASKRDEGLKKTLMNRVKFISGKAKVMLPGANVPKEIPLFVLQLSNYQNVYVELKLQGGLYLYGFGSDLSGSSITPTLLNAYVVPQLEKPEYLVRVCAKVAGTQVATSFRLTKPSTSSYAAEITEEGEIRLK